MVEELLIVFVPLAALSPPRIVCCMMLCSLELVLLFTRFTEGPGTDHDGDECVDETVREG